MLGLTRSPGRLCESPGWPCSVPWRLGGFLFLLLLEGADCLANPGSSSANNSPSVNIYMSVEEVKKLLGKEASPEVDIGLRPTFWGGLDENTREIMPQSPEEQISSH